MRVVHSRFEKVAADAVKRLGPVHLHTLADRIAKGGPASGIASAVPLPDFPDVARRVLSVQLALGMPNEEAAIYLQGVASGHERNQATTTVESVWTGPATHALPVRSTAQVLVDVAGEASHELVLMTYSATAYQPLLDALAWAIEHRVSVMVVVETLRGAESALNGAESAHAFTGLPGVELWHWPVGERAEQGAKMHAKLAVADQRLLLVFSANLTQSGISRSIEAGLRSMSPGARPQCAAMPELNRN